MDAKAALHPTDETLAAFGLGKLGDAAADTIANHVEGCETCRNRAAELSGDSFLGRLKAAQGRDGTPTPSGSLTGVARNIRQTARSTITSSEPVPAELTNHPQYEDVKEIGKGGMGVVYVARNRLMDRIEVLKVANRALLAAPEAIERFLQEIRSAAQLRHPNVVAAYAALEIGQLLVFAMEYVAGQDLDKVVKARGPLPVVNACYYAYQAALGLQHAHEKGMVHRDIKPHNLILTRDGEKAVVKILDFGLAKVTRENVTGEKVDDGLTGDGRMLGTPHYIAPEQTRDAARADIRADIYSLGCTLYFLLTGKTPFSGSLFDVLKAHHDVEARPVHHIRPDVPAGVAEVVAKMMAKEPGERYQTPGEVAKALVPFFKPGQSPDLSQSVAGAVAPSFTDSRTKQSVPPVRSTPSPVAEEPAWEEHPAPGRTRRKSWVLWAAIVVGGLCAGLMIAWGVGAFKVKTKDGTIVLENLPDDADVFVDGEKVTVTWSDGKKAEIHVRPGARRVEVKKDGFRVSGEEVEIEDGKRCILTVKLSPAAPPLEEKGKQPPGGKGKERPVENDGYVLLFNGKDLTGWEVHKWGPANRGEPWAVKNGELIVNFDVFGSWGALLTERNDYQDFRFRVQITPVDGEGWGGSMLYLWREKNTGGWYRAQIGSATGRDVAETGVIKHGNLRVTPKVPMRFRSGEVFTQEVVVEGRQISVYINGVLTTEHLLGEQPQPGQLGLSVSGIGAMRVLRMEVKELPTKPVNPK